MKIGIIGWGVVGSATGEGLRMLGNEIKCHDPKFGTTIDVIKDTEIVFVCVPTPESTQKPGECDVSIIKEIVQELDTLQYTGVIAIKSTCIPGTTQNLINQYQNKNICFVPEFLKERTALQDFVSNHELLAVGCASDRAWHRVCEAHSWLPKNTVKMTPTEAEILKYYSNTYNALRVTFANVMYEVCDQLNSNYSKVLDTFLLRNTNNSDYLICEPDLRGYGGMCLPKDTRAMAELCRRLNLPFNLFKTIDHDNSQIKPTVFPGMRE